MKYILNNTEKTIKFTLTEHPITEPWESPNPLGLKLEELDPENGKDRLKLEENKRHPNYCEAEEITVKPGLNEFENEEHAEWVFQWGGPAYQEQWVNGPEAEYFIVEADEEGNELPKDQSSFYRKYRARKGPELHRGFAPATNPFRTPEAK